MSYPEHIRVSYGTAIVLGLLTAKQDVPPTTAYLLWDPGCLGSCSFCSRGNQNLENDRLARIIWPSFPTIEVARRLREQPGCLRRMCLQTGWNPDEFDTMLALITLFKTAALPLCVTLHPAQITAAETLFQSGVDEIGIGVDAPSALTYRQHKKRDWAIDWPAVLRLIERYPNQVEVHLIFGLGDTEQTFIQAMEEIISRKGKVALFALTPSGPQAAALQPPPLAAYRRIQVFRHLRQSDQLSLGQCRFVDETLVSLDLASKVIQKSLADGTPFRTSGCGDCNRPFYNEKPGGVMYNFPRVLSSQEALQAIQETELFG